MLGELSLLLYVALGGALGSVLRFLTVILVKKLLGSGFPWEMVVVNTLGCFVVGFFAAFLYLKFPHPRWIMFVYWGLIGGFTAFSSFVKEGLHLFVHGDHLTGFFYLLLQNTLGMLAAAVAFYGGKHLFS